MTYNYHKRLIGSLNQDNLTPRRSQSQHAYISAANMKFSTTKIRNRELTNNILKNSSTNICERCNEIYQKSSNNIPSLQNNRNSNIKYQYGNHTTSTNQYFAPEIQTIKKTLIDIRDQMKNGGKVRYDEEENYKRKSQQLGQYTKGYATGQKNQYYGEHELMWRNKAVEKSKIIDELGQKIEQLEEINIGMNKQLSQLKEDKQNSEKRINGYDPELQKIREKLKKAEYDKNIAEERQRALQIKVMDMKEQIMKNQQLLRETNFRDEQNRQTKMMKMVQTKQFNVMINWKKEDENRGSQTMLTDVDIEKGYKEVNEMQDQLCDRINGNLKIEKKIFARIAQITEKVRFLYDKLYVLQDNALKMGIPV